MTTINEVYISYLHYITLAVLLALSCHVTWLSVNEVPRGTKRCHEVQRGTTKYHKVLRGATKCDEAL